MKMTGLQFKMGALVAGAMLVSLAIAMYSVYRVYDAAKDIDRITRANSEARQVIVRAELAFKIQVQEWKNVLLRGRNPATLDTYWKAFVEAESAVQALVGQARAATTQDDIRRRLDRFDEEHRQAGEKYRAALKVFRDGNFDPHAGDRAAPEADRVPAATLLGAEAAAVGHGATSVAGTVKEAESVFRLALVLTVLSVMAALVIVWMFLRRTVIEPIGRAAAFAEQIARGDLTNDIPSESRDEIGQLLRAMSRMKAALAEVVGQVRVAAEAVVTASGQVSAGTTDLSQRTEEQASSLEQTAASMEELSSTVKQNADNARQADELSRSATARAKQGGNEVVEMVVTMGDISTSASRIAEIISVIDAIAFQTNILALNAAVEAARAGEQGRGFAVVASEVRTLAQRSAQAAKEIKDLIADSLQKVDGGTRVAETAGDTIQALVIDVQRVSELMGSIAEASAEQSRGVQQVNKTVTEMDKVVQQNASAVQQSAAAAEGMRQQAEGLLRAVGAFRTGHAGAGEGPVPVFAPAAPLRIEGPGERRWKNVR